MIHTKDPSKLLKDTYSSNIIDRWEPERIKTIMSNLTYDNVKIVLQSPEIANKHPSFIK